MESELENNFFQTCAPDFFSHELRKVLENQLTDEITTRTNFLRGIDTLISLLTCHHIPLSSIIPATLAKLFEKKIQFLLRFELLRANPLTFNIQDLVKLGRSLCMQMAIEEDSTAFYNFYISDILPRYSQHVPEQILLEIAKDFELFEETKDFFDEIQPKIIPKKRKAPKLTAKNSPVRRSPRFINAQMINKEKKLNISRSLNGAIVKKQISVRGFKRVVPQTPEPPQAQLSIEAKKLQEINQKYFYDKKENNSKFEKEEEEVKDDGSKILVLSTPTKQDNQMVYELKSYKNIFNV